MISKIIRRTHMYLALFLVPWVVMYALSTLSMNHSSLFETWYDHKPIAWTLDRVVPYETDFPAETKRWVVADQILSDLGLEGAHNIGGDLKNQITITRRNAVTPQRIQYNPKEQTLRIETQEFRTQAFLAQMHRRKGYDTEFLADDLWAITVDLFILGTAAWAASGLWMWWELKVTRTWGGICLASGVTLFTLFLLTI
ncbi:MAG: hypothetical protein O3B73_10540 [bacterium]|nr:hypothetical protein [bacterium]